jgi:hypothetical protein
VPIIEPISTQRDGTSRPARYLAALEPASVAVDERSVQDLLAFAQDYARRLFFHPADGSAPCDWSGLFPFPSDLDLKAAAAFLDEPASAGVSLAEKLTRPHFVLLLVFLHLRRMVQRELNTFTARHLDHYYQRVLRLGPTPAAADRVHVLVELAAGVDRFELPARTLLDAGDESDEPRLYRTEKTLVVSRAQVARICTVHVEKRITGIREAREPDASPRDPSVKNPWRDRTRNMLGIALGRVKADGPLLPGGELPKCRLGGNEETVDRDFLYNKVKPLIEFPRKNLHLTFVELGTISKARAGEKNWDEIHSILESAGRRKRSPVLCLLKSKPKTLDPIKEIPGVKIIIVRDGNVLWLQVMDKKGVVGREYREDRPTLAVTAGAIARLKRQLRNLWPPHELTIPETQTIVAAASSIVGLEPAAYELGTGTDASNFDNHFKDATEAPDFTNVGGSLTALADRLTELENYFSLPAVQIFELIRVIGREDQREETPPRQWERAYAILARAHERKVAHWRELLQKMPKEDGRSSKREEKKKLAFDKVLRKALGEDLGNQADDRLLKRLEYFLKLEDYEFLKKFRTDTSADWSRAYSIVELAVCRSFGTEEMVPRKEEWLHLRAVDDATNDRVDEVASGREPGSGRASVTWSREVPVTEVYSSPEPDALPRWKTFGCAESQAQDRPAAPVIGWAIRSPILVLGEGRRSITLTLGFAQHTFNTARVHAALTPKPGKPKPGKPEEKETFIPLLLQLSSAKGWLEPPGSVLVELGLYDLLKADASSDSAAQKNAIRFKLEFPAQADPIAPPQAAPGEAASPWPMLRLMLRPVWEAGDLGRYVTPYSAFRDLVLEQVHLRVEVGHESPGKGLTEFLARNDDAVIDPKQPFLPFGPSPSVGSSLKVGHPELVSKRLDSVTFHYEWAGAPANLQDHYANYPGNKSLSNAGFTTRISMSGSRGEQILQGSSSESLFRGGNTTGPQSIKITGKDLYSAQEGSSRDGRELGADLGPDLRAWPRYFQWQLNDPDFQHQAHPAATARKSAELAAAFATMVAQPTPTSTSPPSSPPPTSVSPAKKTAVDPVPYLVNTPYTPRIKSLSISYSASLEINVSNYRRGAGPEQIDHVHPFGACEIVPEPTAGGYTLLPRYDNEGELYIGISDLRPPQTLTLLFQMAEGSGDPDLKAVPVRWSYLSGDCWIDLDSRRVLSDTTRGLINSGIVELDIGPVAPSTRMPAGLAWIRVTVLRNAAALCDTVAIHAQAVAAVFAVDSDGARPSGRPLPAGTITAPAEPVAQIARLDQPYTSFGGAGEEGKADFRVRVSERLRHKQRALAPWDYERLVLERFPEVYKVKCLRPDPDDDPASSGSLDVVLVPDIRRRTPFNPFQPKPSAELCRRVHEYLADKVPGAARIRVRGARFIGVRVWVVVRFSAAGDVEFHQQRLVDELNRFLSPWAYREGAELVIGGRIYANSIVNFIDGLSYVENVTFIRLYRIDERRQTLVKDRKDDVTGYNVSTGRPDEILVAAESHYVEVITPEAIPHEDHDSLGHRGGADAV